MPCFLLSIGQRWVHCAVPVALMKLTLGEDSDTLAHERGVIGFLEWKMIEYDVVVGCREAALRLFWGWTTS